MDPLRNAPIRLMCRIAQQLIVVVLVGSSLPGCDPDPVDPVPEDVLQLLDRGEGYARDMGEGQVRREYSRIEESYVGLRGCYIDVAETLGEGPAGPQKERLLDVLGEWEIVLGGFRAAKQAVGEPVSTETVEPGREIPKDALKEMEAFYSIHRIGV